jgi:hypothetical protein
VEIVEGFMDRFRGEDMDLIAVLARRIWLRRNTLVYKGLFIPPAKVFSYAAENLQDFVSKRGSVRFPIRNKTGFLQPRYGSRFLRI